MNPFRRLRERFEARDFCYAADVKLGTLGEQLAETSEPHRRASSLFKMADLELARSHRQHAAFGRDRLSDDGMDMADSLLFTSMLYRCLADVEHVVACNGRVGRNYRFRRELGEAADEVLDRMVRVQSLAWRVALLEDLYDAVIGKVGGQAAEVLWTLPSPGCSGWLTVADKEDWLAERAAAAVRRIGS